MDDEDLYCVGCGASLLGIVHQVQPPRRFRYDPASGTWRETTPEGAFHFVCAGCGARLDEDAQDHLFEHIEAARPPGWAYLDDHSLDGS